MLKNYIVMLNDDAHHSDIEKTIAGVESAGGKVDNRYYNAIKGFSATIPETHLQVLQDSCKAGDSKIIYIQPDGVVEIDS